jgi:hypothetical protein
VSKKSNLKTGRGQVTLSMGDSKPLVVTRDGGNLTGLGGLPLIRQVERIFRLVGGATARLKDHRTEALIKHNQFDLVFGRVVQIAAGLADANDADLVNRDAGLKKALGRDPEEGQNGASQPTYCRLENEVDEEDLERLFDFLIDYYIATHSNAPKRILLYCDGSAVTAHGCQEGAVYRGGKYRKEMFFPLFIFDQSGWLLAAKLREGDKGEAPSGAPVLQAVIEKLQAAWPKVRIGVRADAAFASPGLLSWCEDHAVDYVIGIPGNFAIAVLSADYHREAKRKFICKHGQPQFEGPKGKKKKQKMHAQIRRMPKDRRMEAESAWRKRRVRVYGEIMHKSRTWKFDRRIICRSDYTDTGLQAKYVVTNITWDLPQRIYEQEYCIRANVELSIKEFKNSLLLRLSCQNFTANAFRLYLHGMAYQLLYHLRGFLPPRLQKLSLDSVRKRFINVAVAVTCSQRRVYWGLSDTYVHTNDFLRLCRKFARAG